MTKLPIDELEAEAEQVLNNMHPRGESYYNLSSLWCLWDLMGKMEHLESMQERLEAIGATEAAQETKTLLLEIQRLNKRVRFFLDPLIKVWEAVDYWDSNDWGPDMVMKALEKYAHAKAVEHTGIAKYEVDCYTQNCWDKTPGFPENTYQADSPEAVTDILRNVSREISGIRKVVVHIVEPDKEVL